MIFGHLRGWWFRLRYRNLPTRGTTPIASIIVEGDGSPPSPESLALNEEMLALHRAHLEADRASRPRRRWRR